MRTTRHAAFPTHLPTAFCRSRLTKCASDWSGWPTYAPAPDNLSIACGFARVIGRPVVGMSAEIFRRSANRRNNTVRNRTKEHICVSSHYPFVISFTRRWARNAFAAHRARYAQDRTMKENKHRLQAHAEPYDTNLILAEVNNLIVAAEERIEQQRKYLDAVASDGEASTRGTMKLERMLVALGKLNSFRARIGP